METQIAALQVEFAAEEEEYTRMAGQGVHALESVQQAREAMGKRRTTEQEKH